MSKTLPDKLYFKIGEVAKMAEVPTHVLRYWESEFPAIKPKRANSKQRLYRRKDVELILEVKTLLHEKGFTIAGAKRLLENPDALKEVQREEPSPPTEDTSSRLKTIKEGLLDLQSILLDKKP